MNPLRFVAALCCRKQRDADMTVEMRAHLDAQTQRNLAAGMSPDEARAAAYRQFGGVAQIQERVRDERGFVWLEQLLQDVRYAARGMLKARMFSGAAVLTLALGIGVTAAMFSVIHGVLLEPYPYANSGEIWAPEVRDLKTGRQGGFRLSHYHELAQLPAVASAMATAFGTARLATDLNPEIIVTPRVTATAFDFLGVPAVLGRGIGPTDFKPGGEPELVTVLSFRFWQRVFHGDADVLGRTLTLDGQTYTVIGVMPPRFGWYTHNGVWLPLAEHDLKRGVRPIVRFHPGITQPVAEEQLQARIEEIAKQSPGEMPRDGFTVAFRNYLDVTVASGSMRSSLHLLFGGVGFLLLIACANVANLQLARGTSRRREIALRLALGATRGRLVRQLLTESFGLALAGGAVGILLALALVKVLVLLMPEHYVPNEARVAINAPVLGFTLIVAMLTGVLFGLVPAWQCTRPNLNETLKDGGNAHGAGSGVRGARTRHALVVLEVALSVVLLLGAGLAIQHFIKLQQVEPGFRIESTLFAGVPLSAAAYPTIERRNQFSAAFLERIRAFPQVVSATVGAPPGLEARSGVTIPGEEKPADGVELNFIDADYLQTLDLPLRDGRNLTAHEVANGDRVALVSAAAARLWGEGRSPVGRMIAVDALVGGGTDNLTRPDAVREVTVVGIVSDTHVRNLRVPPAVVFVPYTLRAPLHRNVIIRTHGTPAGVVSDLRLALRGLDPDLPMREPFQIEDVREQQTVQPRFNMTLFTALAGIALALAAAGIYAVMSYSVTQRTREIGVRVALGAQRHDVYRLIIGSSGRLLVLGLLFGVGTGALLVRLVKSQVFDAPRLDPLTIAAAVALLCVAALAASWLPARRAAKVDPMVALRAE